MKIDSSRLIIRLNIDKERMSEFEDRSQETSQTEIQREKQNKKDKTEYPRMVGQLQKV